MSVAVRPHTKFMSAVLAAGVVAAAAPVWVPPIEDAAPAISDAAVMPASVVTDLLYNFGVAVENTTWAVANPIYAGVSIPFNAVYALVASLRDPALIGSVLSYVTQVYLNPVFADGGYAENQRYYFEQLASVLPLGGLIANVLNGVSDGIGGAFGVLPSPWAGGALFNHIGFETDPGLALWAIREAIIAPVEIIAQTVSYLGYLPAELEATLESAIRNPFEIPGLISKLALDLLDPVNGLVGEILYDLVYPLTLLPAPLGDHLDGELGWVHTAFEALTEAAANVLRSLLPAPVSPQVFSTAVAREVSDISSTDIGTDGSLPGANLFTVDVSGGDFGGADPASGELEGGDLEGGKLVGGEPASGEPDGGEPAGGEPELNEPGINEPEADEPEANEPEADEPEANEPEADEPEADEPEANEPDNNADGNTGGGNEGDGNEAAA